MKKSVFFVLLMALMASFTLTSCERNYVTQVIEKCDCVNRNVEFTIRNQDWQEGPGASGIDYLFATIEIPELTKAAYLNGSVTCYAEYYWGTPNAYQRAMPFCQHGTWTDELGNIYLCTTTLDFEYTERYLTVFYTNSDATSLSFYLPTEPGDMHFHVNIRY